MYLKGKGVKQDEAQAVDLFRKACDRNSGESCYNVGVAYEYGRGVGQDNAQALNYYSKACDMKDPEGCENYATLKTGRR